MDFEVSALYLETDQDVPGRRRFERLARDGHREVPTELFAEMPDDPLAHGIRVAHHEQELGVREVCDEVVQNVEMMRRLDDEHRRLGALANA